MWSESKSMKCVDKFREFKNLDLDACKNKCDSDSACKKFGFSYENSVCRFPLSEKIKCEVLESPSYSSSSYYRPPLVELKLDPSIKDISTESSKYACLSECMHYDGSSGCEIFDNKLCYASLGAGIPMSSSSSTPDVQELHVGTGHDGDATTQSKAYDLSQSSLVGRSCADAKMMKTSSFTASTLTLTSSPSSGCFNVEDEILIWNQGNGVHYFRTVASMTSNVITIKGGEIDVEKLGSSTSLLVQRVPNYNKLTVVSGSTLTHAAYGTSGYGGVLAFRVFTSLVVQDGGVIDMHEKGYRGGTSGSADGLEYYGGRKSDGGMLSFSLLFLFSLSRRLQLANTQVVRAATVEGHMFAVITEPVTTEQMVQVVVVAAVVATVEVPAHHRVVVEVEGLEEGTVIRMVDMAVPGLKLVHEVQTMGMVVAGAQLEAVQVEVQHT